MDKKINFFEYSSPSRVVYHFERVLPGPNGPETFKVAYVGLDTVDQYQVQDKSAQYVKSYLGYPTLGVPPEDTLPIAGLTSEMIEDATRVEYALSIAREELKDGSHAYNLLEILQMGQVMGRVFEQLLHDVNSAMMKLRRMEDDPGNHRPKVVEDLPLHL